SRLRGLGRPAHFSEQLPSELLFLSPLLLQNDNTFEPGNVVTARLRRGRGRCRVTSSHHPNDRVALPLTDATNVPLWGELVDVLPHCSHPFTGESSLRKSPCANRTS